MNPTIRQHLFVVYTANSKLKFQFLNLKTHRKIVTFHIQSMTSTVQIQSVLDQIAQSQSLFLNIVAMNRGQQSVG